MEARQQTWQLPGTSTPRKPKMHSCDRKGRNGEFLFKQPSEDSGMPRNKLGNLRVDISTNLR